MAVSITAALFATATAAYGASFTTPVKLGGPPGGGEPSIAVDGSNVYVVGPQGIPSGVNGNGGIGFWVSRDNGSSFAPGRFIGSYAGGGDSDVTVTGGAVYVADLEAAATEICKSTDHGATFGAIGPLPDPGGCTTISAGQAGPSNDRQWLTPDPSGRLYLTYHEFVSAQPLVFRDDNGGGHLFADGPCGSIVTDPAIEANIPTDVTGGTLVARPVTDAKGNLYILFATTTQQQNAAAIAAGQPSGTFSQLYLAVSHDHCQTFTDYTVFDGAKRGTNTVQFGDIFNDLAIDGAGNLYVVGAGFIGTKPFDAAANVYLLRSTDLGKTWSAPITLDKPTAAHMLPAATGGPEAGQLSIGYFRTTNGVTDPTNTTGQWTYSTAQSFDAAAAQPRFSYSDVNPGFIYHHGQICNAGILCGLPGEPSDRSLLDFTSAAIDAAGCPLYTFAGNPDAKAGTANFATRQTNQCFAHPAGFRGSQSGGAQGSAPSRQQGASGSGGAARPHSPARQLRHRSAHRCRSGARRRSRGLLRPRARHAAGAAASVRHHKPRARACVAPRRGRPRARKR
jgi:hypothetical protein